MRQRFAAGRLAEPDGAIHEFLEFAGSFLCLCRRMIFELPRPDSDRLKFHSIEYSALGGSCAVSTLTSTLAAELHCISRLSEGACMDTIQQKMNRRSFLK